VIQSSDLFLAVLFQMFVTQISNSASHVCDTVIKITHSMNHLPHPQTGRMVVCVTEMSQISDISVTQ